MYLNNYAYYVISTGLIENVIYIEDEVAQTLVWPENYSIVKIPDDLVGERAMCGIGWSYIDNQFVEPPKPPEPIQPIVEGAQTL